jgi:hypothetical protein
MGMKTLYEKINGRNMVQVKMSQDGTQLSTVVVTALGINREEKSLSYSTQGIDVTAMNETKSPNFINSLSGKVAGVQVVPPGFNTGSVRNIYRALRLNKSCLLGFLWFMDALINF